jgi:hypothetical protein
MLSSYVVEVLLAFGILFLVCCLAGFNYEYRRGRRLATELRAKQAQNPWRWAKRYTKRQTDSQQDRRAPSQPMRLISKL